MELSGVETRECQKCIHQPPKPARLPLDSCSRTPLLLLRHGRTVKESLRESLYGSERGTKLMCCGSNEATQRVLAALDLGSHGLQTGSKVMHRCLLYTSDAADDL